ncbi:MAG: CinA family protein [Candidatus Nitrotoga sp.]
MESLASQIGTSLKAYGYMLATAESCTGGGVAQALTDIAGSSAWFERGFITYSNQSKQEMLFVTKNTLERFGAVSENTVREMVAGALRQSPAQIALAVSGIAGPSGGTAEKPVGMVWFAWGIKDKSCVARLHYFTGNRAEIRAQSVNIALFGVLELLNCLTENA